MLQHEYVREKKGVEVFKCEGYLVEKEVLGIVLGYKRGLNEGLKKHKVVILCILFII